MPFQKGEPELKPKSGKIGLDLLSQLGPLNSKHFLSTWKRNLHIPDERDLGNKEKTLGGSKTATKVDFSQGHQKELERVKR